MTERMKMNTDDDSDNDEEQRAPFTLLHTRRFASKSTVLRLCPSMDLLFILSAAASSSLTLYRSVTFQKLVTLTCSQVDASIMDETTAQFTHAAWRPDGRWLACANHQGNVVLHDLEALLSSSSVVVTSMHREDSSASLLQQQFASFAFPSFSKKKLRALVWSHMGKAHPAWSRERCGEDEENKHNTILDEEEDLQYWELHPSKFATDRESLHLPYQHSQIMKRKTNDMVSSTLPTSQTVLSVLVAISEDQDSGTFHLHGCLHGCYPLLKNLPIPAVLSSSLPQDDEVQRDAIVVTSTNLTQMAVCVPSRQHAVTLYSIPSLQQHRYALQTISALYASTTSRMHRLREALPDILGSWKSSLKPLDMKVQALVRLLENYGLLEQTALRQLLVQYILSGHTRAAPNLSNAMDQFFTSVQMNDQLIQRLEVSLFVAVANVESQCREHLLEPAQACVYQFSTLHGLARQIEADPLLEIEDDTVMLLSAKHSLRCLQHAELLLVTVESTLVKLMEARIRLQDWLGWLRAVGAQIKARGTAPQSARHENARKRRAPDAVVHRLLRYLSEAGDEADGGLTTESILHLEFAQLLLDSTLKNTSVITLPQCFSAVETAATSLFAGPPQSITQQLQTTQLLFGDVTSSQSIAMIIRVGRGNAVGEYDGVYCPAPNAHRFRQWLVAARASNDKKCFDLHAVPLSCKGTNSLASSHTWTARIEWDHCDEILALEFYSDDGKSTLSGESNGKEGPRQSLALLTRVADAVQLSVIPYEDLELTMQTLEKRGSSWILPQPISTVQVQTYGSNDDDEGEGGIVYAKTRTIAGSTSGSNLVLSGSRGMAAVECSQDPHGVVWNLFDLEEDEEEVDEKESEYNEHPSVA